MNSASTQHWAVVGGGMLGLTLALRLRQAGHEVTILEGAETIGGLASAWTLGDVTWDRHYHVTLLSDLRLRGILREIGMEDELEWVITKTGFHTGERLYSISNGLEFLRLPVLGLFDKLRLAVTILHGSRTDDWRKLERIPVRDWLIRWSGRRTFDRLWLPLLRAKLGENYRETSAAFIWATIQRLYAARRTGLKKEMFGYVRGGYARVLERYREHLEGLGVEVETGCPADEITPFDDGGVRIRTADRDRIFDHAVVTAAPPIANRICRGLSEEERRLNDGIRYQGIVCASVLLRRPLADYYLTYLTNEWAPFTAVVEMTAFVNPREVGGNHLVYLPKYVPRDDPFFERTDDEIREVFLRALEKMYPAFRRDDVLAFRVSRVPYVFAISTLGYSGSLPPQKTSVPGLHLVSSAHIVNGTLNVNETVDLAERAAKQLTGAGPGSGGAS